MLIFSLSQRKNWLQSVLIHGLDAIEGSSSSLLSYPQNQLVSCGHRVAAGSTGNIRLSCFLSRAREKFVPKHGMSTFGEFNRAAAFFLHELLEVTITIQDVPLELGSAPPPPKGDCSVVTLPGTFHFLCERPVPA